MLSLEEQRQVDIQKVLEIYGKADISLTGTFFEEYSRFYDFTNEKLFALFELLKLNGKESALTVLSSGDHVFNLILQGINTVTTFDCNRLTEYYALGFKKTAIEILNYEQFIELFCPYGYSAVSSKLNELEKEVIKNMPLAYRKFWESFLNMRREYEYNPSVFHLTYSTSNFAKALSNNKYLLNAEMYNALKRKISNAKIEFVATNITDVPKLFGRYDYIDFSNVLYFYQGIFPEESAKKAINLVKSVYENNLNKDGLFKYYYNFDGVRTFPKFGSNIEKEYVLDSDTTSILKRTINMD
ncbi:MAG: DUF3419 family protein [Bacilli bacterium]|nr:DUF3419 family protein [Bacilli bacterium]